MVHNSTLFTLKTLCVGVSLLESLVMTRVICHDSSHSLTRVNMRSSQSQVRVISQVTRVKSSQNFDMLQHCLSDCSEKDKRRNRG